MNHLFSDKPFNEEKYHSLINQQFKASKDEIMDAVHGYHILEKQKFKMTHAKAHMDFINNTIDENEIEHSLRSHPYDAPGSDNISPLSIQCTLAAVKRKKFSI